MGGSSGGVITHSVINDLSDPQVHGALPDKMRHAIDPIIAMAPANWTAADRMVLAYVHGWALVHLD